TSPAATPSGPEPSSARVDGRGTRPSTPADERSGREALRHAGRVRIDVGVAAELLDLVHQLVGDLAQHEVVGFAPTVAVQVERGPEPDLDRAKEARQPGIDRLALVGADEADGHEGCAGAQSEARHAGVATVEQAVTRAGALGIDRERAAAREHLLRG